MRATAALVMIVAAACIVVSPSAEQGYVPHGYDRPHGTRDTGWVFCTLRYRKVRSEPMGSGWRTDWPYAGRNFSKRVSELTRIHVTPDERGQWPMQWIVNASADGDALSTCPLVFTSDVGTLEWLPGEPERIRAYLLKGGTLWVDDFWGPDAWRFWEAELARVLDPARYPVVDVPDDHPILTYPYIVGRWQMTNAPRWRGTGGDTTEQGQTEPVFRAVFDDYGRLMVLMTHNTDVFDGWEQEAYRGFFAEFAGRSYGLGVNVLLHVMTH